jgi:hypothetical protein
VDSDVYIVNNKTDLLDITKILLKVVLNKIHKYINFRENEETIKNGQSLHTTTFLSRQMIVCLFLIL